MLTVTEYLDSRPRGVLVSFGILLFAAVVAGDYLTHTNYALEFSPFYLVPVSFFSWFIGRQSGFALAFLSVGSGFFIRLRPVPRAVAFWDALLWFALYISSVVMIAQLKRLYEHERHLSRIDPLTMVENRRAFFESANRARSFSERHQAPLSLAYLDLDDFKQLNDRWGHTTGDKLLVVVADCVRRTLRPTDVVARIGGDEFALLLPETDKDAAVRVVSRVRQELDRAMLERAWVMTFSIGLVNFAAPIESVAEMLQAADEVMYAAKRRGKNQLEQREIAV